MLLPRRSVYDSPASLSLDGRLAPHSQTHLEPPPPPANAVPHCKRRMSSMPHPNRLLDDSNIQLVPAPPHLGARILDPPSLEHLVHARRTCEPKAHQPRPHQQPRCGELGVELSPERACLKMVDLVHIVHRLHKGLFGG